MLMAYVHIAHDCNLGNHIIMANAATLAGHVEIQITAFVGPLCAIHQFCRMGAYSFLGGYYGGHPGRAALFQDQRAAPPRGVWRESVNLERQGLSKEDIKDLDAALRLLTRSKLNTTQALEAI